MSSARQRHPVAGLGLLLVLLTVLASCGTGQITQTARQQSSANGASGDIGPIAVRNAEFLFPPTGHQYPAGASVMLGLTIVNTGSNGDRLASVDSPVAGSVRIDGPTAIAAQRSVRAVARVLTEPYQDEPAGTGDEQTGELNIIMVDLNKAIRPGLTVPVVLLFENAGEVLIQVPVAAP